MQPNRPRLPAERPAFPLDDPERRAAEGDALISRARENHSEERYVGDLLELYRRVSEGG